MSKTDASKKSGKKKKLRKLAAQNHRAPVIGVAQRRCILLNTGDGGAYRRVTRLPPGVR